ncbi:MAG: VOC family protein [Bacteroidetes bacterium]|nr:VOC family protein [Bacteroidota bacterium]
MKKDVNSLNWFEIPAKNIKRSKKFYENIFGIKMEEMEMNGMQMAFFPWKEGSGKANGGLVQSKMHKPSKDGAVIYLNANPKLDKVLAKIPKAGGKVVMPKMQAGDFGFMAFFIDSEGNRVALHSQK